MDWLFVPIKRIQYKSLERTCTSAGRPSQYANNSRAYSLDYRLLVNFEDQSRHLQMTARRPSGSSVPKHVYAVDALKAYLAKRLLRGKALRAEELFDDYDGVKNDAGPSFLASVLRHLGVLRARKSQDGDFYEYSLGDWTQVDALFESCSPPIDPTKIKIPKCD